MNLDTKILFKVLSPRLATQAIQAFDRSTTVVVGACWGAAVFMIAFALYTLHLSVVTRHSADLAIVAEPSLPTIVRSKIDAREIQALVDRLQKQYPEISFSIHNNLTITAAEGSKFRQWLMALSYVDTISPQFHWVIQEFCVGNCGTHDLMKAVLTGEKISFEKPQQDIKD